MLERWDWPLFLTPQTRPAQHTVSSRVVFLSFILYTIRLAKTRAIPWRSWLAATLSPRDFALTTPAHIASPRPSTEHHGPQEGQRHQGDRTLEEAQEERQRHHVQEGHPQDGQGQQDRGQEGLALEESVVCRQSCDRRSSSRRRRRIKSIVNQSSPSQQEGTSRPARGIARPNQPNKQPESIEQSLRCE